MPLHCDVMVTVIHSQDTMMPVEAELVGAQIDVSEILLLIFTEYSAEKQSTRCVNQGKSSIEKVSVS